MRHVPSVFRFLIESAAQRLVWLGMSLADQPHPIQQLLRAQVVADHFAVLADIDHIKRMQAVLVADVHIIADVSQDENHPWRHIIRGGYDGMHPVGRVLHVVMVLDVFQQVKPEFVQAQIHDGYAALHILYIYHFFHQPL